MNTSSSLQANLWPHASLTLVALALATSYRPAYALGLGEADSQAQLGQPLALRVALSATREEARGLNARLLSLSTPAEAIYDTATLDRSFRTSIEVDAQGRAQVVVRSLSRITEPYIEFKVEVSSGDTRVQRDFTVFVDPPHFDRLEPPMPQPAASTAVAAVQPRAAPAPTTLRVDPPRPPVQARAAPRPRPAAGPALTGSTYVVRSGDCLSAIAERLARATGRPAAEVADRIYRANPQAFGGRPELLYAGAQLALETPAAEPGHRLMLAEALAPQHRQALPEPAAAPKAPAVPGAKTLPLAATPEPASVRREPQLQAVQLHLAEQADFRRPADPPRVAPWLLPIAPADAAGAGPARHAPAAVGAYSLGAVVTTSLLSSILTSAFMLGAFLLFRTPVRRR